MVANIDFIMMNYNI